MGVERWVMARVVVESGEMLRCSRPPWVGILSIGCSPAAAMLKAGPGSGERRGRAAAAVSVGEASGGRWRRWLSGVAVMEEEVAAAAVAAAATLGAAGPAVERPRSSSGSPRGRGSRVRQCW